MSDAFSEDGADQRDGFRKIRADQRDGSSKTRADHGDEFGFYSRKRTCKCQEETGETKSASRRNRFLALTAIESDNDEEVNARWNNVMLHLSIWKQMRSTCSVAFVVRCLIRAVQLFGSKACWAQDFCVSRLFVRLFRKSVIRLMSLFGEYRSTTFCSSPPPPIPSPPLGPTTRRERNPPHNAPFRTRMCCVALWHKPSTTQVTSPKVASMPGQCTTIHSPLDDSIFNRVDNSTRTLAVSEDIATTVPAFLKSWFILRHEPLVARKCARFELDLKLQERRFCFNC